MSGRAKPAPHAYEVAMASATLAPGAAAVPNGAPSMASSAKEPSGRAAAAVLSVSTPEKAMSEELKE